MRQCMTHDPDERPTFIDIIKELESMRHDGEASVCIAPRPLSLALLTAAAAPCRPSFV